MSTIGRQLDEIVVQGRRFIEDWKSAVVSYSSGCLFFIGWWLILDVAVVYPLQAQFPHAYHCIGLVTTVAFIMIVAPKVRDEWDGGILNSLRSVRLIVFMGFLIGFTCVIASLWILFEDYVIDKHHLSAWPGVALFLQNLLIFTSAVAWRIGHRTDDYTEF